VIENALLLAFSIRSAIPIRSAIAAFSFCSSFVDFVQLVILKSLPRFE